MKQRLDAALFARGLLMISIQELPPWTLAVCAVGVEKKITEFFLAELFQS